MIKASTRRSEKNGNIIGKVKVETACTYEAEVLMAKLLEVIVLNDGSIKKDNEDDKITQILNDVYTIYYKFYSKSKEMINNDSNIAKSK